MLTRNPKNIVVIGAGLAGLVTIVECINNARQYQDKLFNLHIVEKRSLDFNRRQKLILAQFNTLKYCKYPATYWQEFCEKNFDSDGEIRKKFNSFNGNKKESNTTINHREKFLFKLWRQNNLYFHDIRWNLAKTNFSIKELQLALYEHIQHSSCPNIKIEWHHPATVRSINANTNELIIEDLNSKINTVLNYDDIVIAEGSKGEVTEIINQTLNYPFKFKRFSFPILYHGSARLQLKTTTLNPLSQNSSLVHLSENTRNIQVQFNAELLKKFQALGHQSDKLPNSYILDDNYYNYKNGRANLRLFVASEIPKSIYSIADKKEKKQAVIAWSKLIAALEYNISDEYFEFDPKGETNDSSINALAFDNELKYVEMPVLKLSPNNYIYLIGDAAISNFYPLGFSSLIAATEASYVSQFICNNNPAYDRYADLCKYYRFFVQDTLPVIGRILHRNFEEEFESQQRSQQNSMDMTP